MLLNNGATTLSITTLRIATCSINDTQHNNIATIVCRNAEYHVLFIVMLSVLAPLIIQLNVSSNLK